MSKRQYEGPDEFKPISTWGYVGYTILFAIPILGFILLLVFAFSQKKINRRNFARSFLCLILIAIVLFLGSIVLTRLGVGDLTGPLKLISPQIRQSIESIENIIPASGDNTPKATKTSSSKASAISQPDLTGAPAQSAAGVRPEVKAAIDGYVAFFEEYAAFMKKYSTSSNALTMLADYSKMLTAYAKNMEEWEKFEKKYADLNQAEMKYYTDATLRIEKALLNVI